MSMIAQQLTMFPLDREIGADLADKNVVAEVILSVQALVFFRGR